MSKVVKLTGKFRAPTLKEKVTMYENFLHKINACCIGMDNEAVKKLVANADAWSYAHRVGNGEFSDIQQQRVVTDAFYKLLDV